LCCGQKTGGITEAVLARRDLYPNTSGFVLTGNPELGFGPAGDEATRYKSLVTHNWHSRRQPSWMRVKTVPSQSEMCGRCVQVAATDWLEIVFKIPKD
jgi:hypothetical protein